MKKFTKKDLQFRRIQEKVLFKKTGEIDGHSFVCRNLTKCKVYLPCLTSTIYIDDCSNCEIYLGPTESSVFIRDCTRCTISLCAQQIRISDSADLTVFLFSSTDLTLEKASRITLAPYNFVYPGIKQHISDAQIDTSRNQGFVVMDFDLEYSTAEQEMPPNYTLMTSGSFPGFHEFHDAKMLKYYPEDSGLAGLDEQKLESLVETSKREFPIVWPDVFGGTGLNPLRLNSQIRLGEERDFGRPPSEDSMMSFKMGLSPILAHQKFTFNNSNKTVLTSLQMSRKLSVETSQNSNLFKKSQKAVEHSEAILENERPIEPKRQAVTQKEQKTVEKGHNIPKTSEKMLPKSLSQSAQLGKSSVDPQFIRSKLSGNELKVVRNLSEETGNNLLIELFHRRLGQIRENKKKSETERNLKRQRMEQAREAIKDMKMQHTEQIEKNKLRVAERAEPSPNSDGGVWELIRNQLKADKKNRKKRFIEAVECKEKLSD